MVRQVGLRFDHPLWMDYRRICSSERVRPNELLEMVIRDAVVSGSVKALIDRGSTVSGSQAVADKVRLERLLGDMQRLMETVYRELELWYEDKGEPGDHVEEADRLTNQILSILPRISDQQAIEQAGLVLGRAARYRNRILLAMTPRSKTEFELILKLGLLEKDKMDAEDARTLAEEIAADKAKAEAETE